MKIVTFHGYRGGNGKSTLISNLAYCLSKHRKKVLVVDADFHAPALHDIFEDYCNFENAHTLLEFLMKIDVEIEDVMSPIYLGDVTFDAIFCGKPKSLDLGLLGYVLSGVKRGLKAEVERIRDGLAQLDKLYQYDVALIDLTPGVPFHTLYCASYLSNYIIEVVRDSVLEHYQTKNYVVPYFKSVLQIKQKETGEETGFSVLINEVLLKDTHEYFMKEYEWGKELILGKVWFSDRLRELRKRVVITFEEPEDPFSISMEAISQNKIFE